MTTIFATVCIVLMAVCAFIMCWCCLKIGEHKGNEKADNNSKDKTKLKETMETGNSRSDFDNSLNILHDLSQK